VCVYRWMLLMMCVYRWMLMMCVCTGECWWWCVCVQVNVDVDDDVCVQVNVDDVCVCVYRWMLMMMMCVYRWMLLMMCVCTGECWWCVCVPVNVDDVCVCTGEWWRQCLSPGVATVHQCRSVPSHVAVSGDSSCKTLDLHIDNDDTYMTSNFHLISCISVTGWQQTAFTNVVDLLPMSAVHIQVCQQASVVSFVQCCTVVTDCLVVVVLLDLCCGSFVTLLNSELRIYFEAVHYLPHGIVCRCVMCCLSVCPPCQNNWTYRPTVSLFTSSILLHSQQRHWWNSTEVIGEGSLSIGVVCDFVHAHDCCVWRQQIKSIIIIIIRPRRSTPLMRPVVTDRVA